MADHKVELRKYKSNRVDGWKVDAPQRQILVDGRFVGYCSEKPKLGLNIVTEVPPEIVEAVEAKVAEFWQQDTVEASQATEVVTDDGKGDGEEKDIEE
ncbi:MAG: hypothetical protein AAGF31_07435 [Planctomycetota bacterium]